MDGNSGRVSILKKDLDKVYGTDYPCLTGIVRCYVRWAVEKGGILRKKVDLNAFGSAANTAHEFVGTAHKDFPIGADGLMEYGGDVVAKSGGFAEEFVDIDLGSACGRRDVSDIVFGTTPQESMSTRPWRRFFVSPIPKAGQLGV